MLSLVGCELKYKLTTDLYERLLSLFFTLSLQSILYFNFLLNEQCSHVCLCILFLVLCLDCPLWPVSHINMGLRIEEAILAIPRLV